MIIRPLWSIKIHFEHERVVELSEQEQRMLHFECIHLYIWLDNVNFCHPFNQLLILISMDAFKLMKITVSIIIIICYCYMYCD